MFSVKHQNVALAHFNAILIIITSIIINMSNSTKDFVHMRDNGRKVSKHCYVSNPKTDTIIILMHKNCF